MGKITKTLAYLDGIFINMGACSVEKGYMTFWIFFFPIVGKSCTK